MGEKITRLVDTAGPVRETLIAAPSGGASETVLLVEDDASVRQLLRETLTAKGYRVLEASDGESALPIAADYHGRIKMLITDILMPGITGRELARRICASDPEVKVLYLSGYTEDVLIRERALEPGTAFLQKPFTLQALSGRVGELLRGSGGEP